jgi:transcriptional regulator with XRE-family HTH domain
MPLKERSTDRGTRRGAAIVVELGRELRLARLQHGLSQEALGHAIGMSDTQVGRIERGEVPGASVVCLTRLLSVAGLELSARVSDRRSAARQGATGIAQTVSEDRLRPPSRGGRKSQSAPSATFGPGTRYSVSARIEMGIEAETRLTDLQAVQRRITLKCRDREVGQAVLLLAGTRTNRVMIRTFETSIRNAFPIPGRVALRALREGQLSSGSALILV